MSLDPSYLAFGKVAVAATAAGTEATVVVLDDLDAHPKSLVPVVAVSQHSIVYIE